MKFMEKRLVTFLSNIFSSFTFLLGLTVVFGWLAHIESLVRIVSFLPPMRLAVAIMLIIGSSGIVAIRRQKNWWPKTAAAIMVSYGMIGLFNLGLGLQIPIQLLQLGLATVPYQTFTAILLLGIATYLLTFRESERALRYVLLLAAATFILAVLSLMNYLFRFEGTMGDVSSGMAVHTTVALIFLANSLFFRSAVAEFPSFDVACKWHPIIIVLKEFSVRRKFIVLAVILFTGLTIFGAATFHRFLESAQAWQKYTDSMVPRQKLRYKMRELFGYGGGTFYFKNLILRGTPEYVPLTRDTFGELLKVVDDYMGLPAKTKREVIALENIREAATDYLFNLDIVVGYLKRKIPPREIDLKIWVDDDKALVAFDNLNTEYQVLATEIFDEINRARELLIFVATMGFAFALGTILVFGYLVNNTILTTIGEATQAAHDISNDKFDSQLSTDSNDELGLLMQSLTTMRDRIQESRNTILSKTEDLARSNAFLNSIFENLPSMVYLKDAKSLKYTHFNRAGEKLIGLNRDLILGQNDFDILPRIRAEETRKSDQSALSSGGLVEIPEETMELRTGVRVLNTKKIPILDMSGAPSHILGISEDVTDRRKLERSLKEYRERLNLALKDAHIAAWDWKIIGDAITGDETFYQLLGFDKIPPRLSLAGLCEHIHHEDRGFFTISVLDSIRAQRDLDIKFRFFRPVDRRLRYFVLKAKIYLDYAGKVDLVSGIITDISEKQEADQMHRLTDERFQRIFGHCPIGVLLIDLKGPIHEANEAFLRMTGYHRAELVALKWDAHLTPSEWESVDKKKYTEVVERGWTDIFEKEFLRKDKSRVPVQISVTRLDSQGGNVIMFVRSLSKEKEIERQARSTRDSLDISNQEFEYIMNYLSEEVKEPLHNLFMQTLSKEGLRIDSVLDTLMSYFYVKSENPKFVTLPTKQLIDGVIADLKAARSGADIKIEVGDLPDIVGARSPMEVLFHTLLLMAIKRLSKGGGEIIVSGRASDDGYEIIFKDNGPAISELLRMTNFNMNDIRVIENRQFGLGILICKKIAELHHGKIWSEFAKPGGVTVGFSIPKFS